MKEEMHMRDETAKAHKVLFKEMGYIIKAYSESMHACP